VKYFDVVAGYLPRLKRLAEAEPAPDRARCSAAGVLRRRRPGARRQGAGRARRGGTRGRITETASSTAIAAAFDYEQTVAREQVVLVRHRRRHVRLLGRASAERRLERKDDILANHGVHVAGTDFDRRIELERMLGEFGYRSLGPAQGGVPQREVPSGVYFDLATWHLINTVYSPQRVAELRAMRAFYADARQHRRLMAVLDQHLGHDLLARAEAAKIAVAGGAAARIDLTPVDRPGAD
jgi:hypothetical chaperone protein